MEDVAKILLEIEAVSLKPNKPFTYTSGMKSPIYCDNRLIMSYPDKRKAIIDAFLQLIDENGLKFDVVAGTATAGIPHAAWIAHKLDKPMIYVRSKAKEHGKENMIEGKLEKGQKVLVVEDLVTTGNSSVNAVKGVKEAGGEVIGCVAIITYGFEKAKKAFEDEKCPLFTLTDFNELIDVAAKTDYLDEEDKDKALEWNKDPENWAGKMGF